MSDEALATDRPPERESDAPPEALMEQGLEGLVNQLSEYQRHNFRCFAIGARWIDRGDGAVARPQGALNARWTRCRRFGFDSVEGHAASEKSKSE